MGLQWPTVTNSLITVRYLPCIVFSLFSVTKVLLLLFVFFVFTIFLLAADKRSQEGSIAEPDLRRNCHLPPHPERTQRTDCGGINKFSAVMFAVLPAAL